MRIRSLTTLVLLAIAAPAVAQSPVVLIPLPDEGVDPAVMNAVLSTSVAGLQPLVQRREVQASDAVSAAIVECTDAPCVGQLVANAHGSVGVLVRVSMQASVVHVRFEVVDAMTGAPRGEAVEADVPAEASTDPAQMILALNPAFSSLGPQMPAPPVRTLLLIAINSDGATVSVDGEVVGESPIAPIELQPGSHVISVTQRGFQTFNRSVEVTPDGGRVNVDLEPAPEMAQAMQQQDAAQAEDFVAGAPASKPLYKEWWLWAAVGGGVVLITTVAVIAAVAGGGGGTQGFEIPPIPGGM